MRANVAIDPSEALALARRHEFYHATCSDADGCDPAFCGKRSTQPFMKAAKTADAIGRLSYCCVVKVGGGAADAAALLAETRHTALPTSSAIISAPFESNATPTGRP